MYGSWVNFWPSLGNKPQLRSNGSPVIQSTAYRLLPSMPFHHTTVPLRACVGRAIPPPHNHLAFTPSHLAQLFTCVLCQSHLLHRSMWQGTCLPRSCDPHRVCEESTALQCHAQLAAIKSAQEWIRKSTQQDVVWSPRFEPHTSLLALYPGHSHFSQCYTWKNGV